MCDIDELSNLLKSVSIDQLEQIIKAKKKETREFILKDDRNILNYTSDNAVMSFNLNEHTQASGSVQSGKTKFFTNLALRNIFTRKCHSIVILNNFVCDRISWCDRFQRIIRESVKFHKNVMSESERLMIEYVVIISADMTSAHMQSCIDSVIPKIFVLLGNISTLEKFKNVCKNRNKQNDLYTIVDESDNLSTEKSKCKRATAIHDIIDLSIASCRITATSYSHWMLHERNPLYCENVVKLDVSSDHVSFGHPKFQLNVIEDVYLGNDKNKLSAENIDEIVSIIETEISNSENIGRLPVGMINISTYTAKHKYIRKLIKKYFPQTTFVNIYDSKIVVNYPEDSDLIIFKQHLRETMSLQQNLDFIRRETEEHGVHKLVIIIGCNQISRGQSPRSEVDNYRSYSGIIYAQFLIFAAATSKVTDGLVQSVLRPGGIFKKQDHNFDGIRVYTTSDIIENLSVAMAWNDTSLLEFGKKENVGLRTVEVIPKLAAKPSRKPTTSFKRWKKHKKLTGVYHTNEKMDRDLRNLETVQQKKTNETIELGETQKKKIYNILKNIGNWMNGDDIYNSCNDWVLNSTNPKTVIRARLLELYNNGYIERKMNSSGVYIYKVK